MKITSARFANKNRLPATPTRQTALRNKSKIGVDRLINLFIDFARIKYKASGI